MQNQDGNAPSGQSRSALCRQWCNQNCRVCVIGCAFLVLGLMFLLLYFFWDGEWEMAHRKNMLIWMGVCFVIAFCAFLVTCLPASQPSQQEARRRVRQNERFPIPIGPQSPPTSASTGDSGSRSNFTRSFESFIAFIRRFLRLQVQSGESSRVNSSYPVSAARTPENLQGSSTTAPGSSLPEDSVAVLNPENREPSLQMQEDVNSTNSDSVQTPQSSTNASGSSLPEDAMEIAVMNPKQGGPSQQVQVDVHATDSVPTPTEEQLQSKTDTADLGVNSSKDGEMVVLGREQQEPSTSQQAPASVTNSEDCQDSDVQAPIEKHTDV